jgi:hypothetical protein
MPGPKIKFRCYQCNQLLGVSSTKAGKVVACPKCSTDLVVPELDDPPAPAAGSESPPSTPAFLTALDAGVPLDLVDIRPEDIRVESGDDWKLPPIATDAPWPAPAPGPPPFLAPLGPEAEAGREMPYNLERSPTPIAVQVSPAEAIPAPIPTPPPIDTDVPPIKVEPPSIVPERTTTLRSRDLVLPRSVVATWSLFVLMAQALAFVAGLLAGHYLWRVH